MDSRTTPLILVMVALLLCAVIIPNAAGAILPAAIAQEDTTSLDEENLISGIISNVLDSDDEEENDGADAETVNQDSTDTTATVDPNQEEDQTVDQTDFNEFGDNTVNRLPLEGDAVFCFEPDLPREFFCFDTPEECEVAEELVGGAEEVLGSIISGCEGFETPPPGAIPCSVPEGGQTISCEVTQVPR